MTNYMRGYVNSIFSSLKEYLREHRDVVWTVLLAIALDHYFFGDKFRSKIGAIVDSLLSKHLLEAK